MVPIVPSFARTGSRGRNGVVTGCDSQLVTTTAAEQTAAPILIVIPTEQLTERLRRNHGARTRRQVWARLERMWAEDARVRAH